MSLISLSTVNFNLLLVLFYQSTPSWLKVIGSGSPCQLSQNPCFQSLLVALGSLEETAVISGLFLSGELLR